MSVRFRLQSIEMLLDDVYHLPRGTLVGRDRRGEWFRYAGVPFDGDIEASCWPRKGKAGIPLYRDFWRHVSQSPNSPFGEALRSCSKLLVVG